MSFSDFMTLQYTINKTYDDYLNKSVPLDVAFRLILPTSWECADLQNEQLGIFPFNIKAIIKHHNKSQRKKFFNFSSKIF